MNLEAHGSAKEERGEEGKEEGVGGGEMTFKRIAMASPNKSKRSCFPSSSSSFPPSLPLPLSFFLPSSPRERREVEAKEEGGEEGGEEEEEEEKEGGLLAKNVRDQSRVAARQGTPTDSHMLG